MKDFKKVRDLLLARLETMENPQDILKAEEIKVLAQKIPTLAPEDRASFGRELNILKKDLMHAAEIAEANKMNAEVEPLDISAPTGINEALPELPSAENGSRHPLMTELERVIQIYNLIGFDAVESCQLDSEYNMFDTLNFPKDHPARDNFDTFRTEEGFIPPAHTSTMQNRILKAGKKQLEAGGKIATVSYGRVYRNEDLDATHEHTFYQCEGVYVAEDATLGQMLAVLRNFFEQYYEQKLNIKTQPAYFPFTEPSLEFMIEKPALLAGKKGEFLEMLGCGMIHPNVLKNAGIDPEKYSGFAWGGGIDRLVMLRYGLNDVRHFESGKLEFLKEFK